VAMGWRRDAEGTSKGRRVPLTRRDDLHDAEGTSKGLSLDAKGCPFWAKELSLHVEGIRSFVRFRALSARHTPTSPEKACVGGAHTDTEAAYTRGCGGTQASGGRSACPRKCIEVGPLQPWPGPSPCARLHPRMRPSHPLRGAPPAHSTITLSCTLLRLSLRRCPC